MEEVINKNIKEEKNNREMWIDIIKAISIIAVILNHVIFNLIYTLNIEFSFINVNYTILSVTTFIIMAGYTCCISLSKYEDINYNEYRRKRLYGIIIPYIIASIIYVVFEYGSLNINVLLTNLLYFTANGPFYYVLIFIELVLVSPYIYNIFNKSKNKIVIQLIVLALMLCISYVFLNFTSVTNVYSGAKYLFGATYFFAFGIGFFIYFNLELMKKLKYLICSASLVGLSIFIYMRLIDKVWSNPPNKLAIIYSVLALGFIFSTYQILNRFIKNYDKFFLNKLLSIIGRYSLNIFLYHYLIILILNRLKISEYIKDSMLLFIIYFIPALVVPLLWKIGYDKVNIKKMFESSGGK